MKLIVIVCLEVGECCCAKNCLCCWGCWRATSLLIIACEVNLKSRVWGGGPPNCNCVEVETTYSGIRTDDICPQAPGGGDVPEFLGKLGLDREARSWGGLSFFRITELASLTELNLSTPHSVLHRCLESLLTILTPFFFGVLNCLSTLGLS
jgi:hypothetical protein